MNNTHPSSYEPLAQLHFAKDNSNPTACNLYYYHTDQIGVPRELTDEQGKICWYGDYSGWGKLKDGYDLTEDKSVHQPFRLQNQYADEETGLHYNFFRYYEPNMGRFTQLDPIGLAGGMNAYQFAPNVQGWLDSLGLRNSYVRPNYRRNVNNTYSVGAVSRNKIIIKNNTNPKFPSTNIPTTMRSVNTELVRSNSSQLVMFEYVGGEIKDKLIDYAGLSSNTGQLISSRRVGVNRCEKFKYECILEKRMDDNLCPAIDVLGVEGCYFQEEFYSNTKSHMVPLGVSVECKEIK